MTEGKTTQEPTMEEILASIRRIISEDGPDKESAPQTDAPAASAPPANGKGANGKHVEPPSLYRTQLAARLARRG